MQVQGITKAQHAYMELSKMVARPSYENVSHSARIHVQLQLRYQFASNGMLLLSITPWTSGMVPKKQTHC